MQYYIGISIQNKMWNFERAIRTEHGRIKAKM